MREKAKKKSENTTLKTAIKAVGKTQSQIAKLINVSPSTFYSKLHGLTDFTQTEIGILCKELKKTATFLFFSNCTSTKSSKKEG